MLSKNEVKYIQSLYQKKTRDKEGLFIAEGPKLVNELLQSNFVIKNIYCRHEWMENCNRKNDFIEVSEDELKRISNLQTPHGILAIVQQKNNEYEPALFSNLSLVLDGIQDPGNMGTIIRTADWFGIHQVIASEDTADIYNPKVVQATMGSIANVNVWYKNIEQWLKALPVNVFGASLHGSSLHDSGKIKEGVLVIGNESKGIRNNILPYIQYPLTIPRIGNPESLNAAVATGIILSHITG